MPLWEVTVMVATPSPRETPVMTPVSLMVATLITGFQAKSGAVW